MIILKVGKIWIHVGATPLLRALIMDGAAYYFAFCVAFGLDLVANMSNEVGGSITTAFNTCLFMRYSSIIP